MDKILITEGTDVTFYPSERTSRMFENKLKKSYPAKVTDVNSESVDLTVFGVREIVYVSNIQHKTEAKAERSYWEEDNSQTL